MKKYRELKKLKKLNTVCIITHMNADTDAIGSMTLMRNLLLYLGIKRVDMFTDTNSKLDNYEILTDTKHINVRTAMNYEAAILLDCANSGRIGKYLPLFTNAKLKVNIDHHDTNTNEGDINIV